MYPGLKSKALQAGAPKHRPGGVLSGSLLLTRFACWASASTAPFGHCTGGHLDVGRADFVSEGEEQERAQRRAPCGAII